MTTMHTALLLALGASACTDSSVYEYYELRAEADDQRCRCSTSDQDAIERCRSDREELRERERACAIEYVEDSRKKRKQVEPIYSCFVEGLRERLDCIAEQAECDSTRITSECAEEPEWRCALAHYTSDVTKPVGHIPDDAARGREAIRRCANEDETGG